MAKVSYVGISNKARRVKKLFVGIDGKARKVKKAYIGINGVARLFYGAIEPSTIPGYIFYSGARRYNSTKGYPYIHRYQDFSGISTIILNESTTDLNKKPRVFSAQNKLFMSRAGDKNSFEQIDYDSAATIKGATTSNDSHQMGGNINNLFSGTGTNIVYDPVTLTKIGTMNSGGIISGGYEDLYVCIPKLDSESYRYYDVNVCDQSTCALRRTLVLQSSGRSRAVEAMFDGFSDWGIYESGGYLKYYKINTTTNATIAERASLSGWRSGIAVMHI